MAQKRSLKRIVLDILSDSSPFMTRVGQICVLAILNLLWLICCLPVITAGASSAALAAVLLQYPQQTVGSAFIDFFAAFRKQLRPATPVWLILLICGAVLAVDYRFLVIRELTESLPLMAVFFTALFLYGFLLVWTFPVLAVLGGSTVSVLRDAMLLAVAYLGRSLLCTALMLLAPAAALLYASFFAKTLVFWLIIGFALIALAQMLLVRKPLQKYAEKRNV